MNCDSCGDRVDEIDDPVMVSFLDDLYTHRDCCEEVSW